MDQPPGIYDPAAQLERTALAWSRASVAILVNGALLIRAGLTRGFTIWVGIGSGAAVIGVALWLLSATQYSELAGRRAAHLLAGRPAAVLSLAAFTTLLSAAAAVAILVG